MPYPLRLLIVVLSLGLAAFPARAENVSDPKTAVSGNYEIDPAHTNVVFKVSHLGFSYYVGRFDKIEGTLHFNSTAPDQSSLDATISTTSIDTNNAKLEEDLRGSQWFDVLKYPEATFHATKIQLTGPTTGKITGNFTLKGQTHTVVLDTTFVGTGTMPFTKKQTIGFSAKGMLHRSDYGISNLVPMVGNDVTFEIEAEMDQVE